MSGLSSSCEISGWVKEDKISDWRQSLTLIFTEREGRRPVLFFNDLEALDQVAGSASPSEEAMQLTSQFKAIKLENVLPARRLSDSGDGAAGGSGFAETLLSHADFSDGGAF